VVALFRNGTEWMVRFESGLRFRRPRHEFNGQAAHGLAPAAPLPLPPLPPLPRSQFEARQLLEALRVGIAPVQHLQELTIGLAAERADLSEALNRAHQSGGAVRAVMGDYGFGKSHLVELAAQEALQRNFLVSTTSLDLIELPAHRAIDIYASLMEHLRYPDTDERGLGPLLEAGATQGYLPQLQSLAAVDADPLTVALEALRNTASTRQRQTWVRWLMGGRREKGMHKILPRGVKFPSIYRTGNNARQIAYLLSGISVLARLAGYSGLALLLDEAESYSLLRASQRPKADLVFRALIAAASPTPQRRAGADELPQHHHRDYPLAYGGRQSLFFLFTVTRSDNPMPLEAWLQEEEVLALNPHHTPQEIGQFLQQVMRYHAQAFGYEPGERQGQIRRGAAELLALGMYNGRLHIRGVVRLAVELFDLLYLHPDYTAAALLDELREMTR
jgi:hypothetical protein